MENFLGGYVPLKGIQEATENIHKPVRSKETESVIQKLPTKSLELKGFTGELYQTFQKNSHQHFKNLSKNKRRKGHF